MAEIAVARNRVIDAARRRVHSNYIVRFTVNQRVQHIVLMITFIALSVTGLAEKYWDAGWASWLISSMGGIAATRLIHRIFGVIFVLSIMYHLAYLVYSVSVRHSRLSMMPSLRDVRDVVDSLRYSLGLRDKHTKLPRFDYRQKFEYWGILFGGAMMIISGLILMFPIQVTSFLPGQLVAAARVAHSNEAMLAVLTIAIWHLYDVMLKPGIFPADTSIFTGRISHRRMKEEHALEYEELMAAAQSGLENAPVAANTQPGASPQSAVSYAEVPQDDER